MLASNSKSGGVSMDMTYEVGHAGDAGGELRFSDMVEALGTDRAKLGAARKRLERLDKRSQPVAAPLPPVVANRVQRQAGCAHAFTPAASNVEHHCFLKASLPTSMQP